MCSKKKNLTKKQIIKLLNTLQSTVHIYLEMRVAGMRLFSLGNTKHKRPSTFKNYLLVF